MDLPGASGNGHVRARDILTLRDHAEARAWERLATHHYAEAGDAMQTFANYNRLLPSGLRKTNPFQALVKLARIRRGQGRLFGGEGK